MRVRQTNLLQLASIVELPISGDLMGLQKVSTQQVSAYGRLKMQCLHLAGTIMKCRHEGGVRLGEVSIRGGSTVLH